MCHEVGLGLNENLSGHGESENPLQIDQIKSTSNRKLIKRDYFAGREALGNAVPMNHLHAERVVCLQFRQVLMLAYIT